MPEVQPVEHQVLTEGARIGLRTYLAADLKAPVIVLFPAMGVRARFYHPFAQALFAQGFSVAVADLRGQGDSSPRPGRSTDFGYREMIVHDYAAIIGRVRELLPDAPIFMLGHSLGGQLSLLFASQYSQELSGIALVASGSVYYRAYGPALGLRNLMATQAVGVIATVLGYWPGHRLGFGGLQPRRMMLDWAQQARSGRYRLQGAEIDYEAALAKLELPVFAIHVEDDLMAPIAAVQHLVGKAPNARVTHWRQSRLTASGHAVDHFSWVRHGEDIAAQVASWARSIRG